MHRRDDSARAAARDLIRRIRRIEITTRRAVQATLAGQYHSVFRGRGMAFEEARLYQPGDDVRAIDWNVTARMGEPFVKVFVEERELTVMIAVDCSGSLDFGSGERTKEETAAEIAAMVAFSAVANGDRTGLLLFTDRVERIVPPRKGLKHALRIVAEILQFRPERKGTRIGGALDALGQLLRRRSVAFVLSDFRDEGWERSLLIASRRHDLVPVVIEDSRERVAPPPVGLVPLVDPETGEAAWVDTSSARFRAAFETEARARREARERIFRRAGVQRVEIAPGGDYARALTAFFRARALRAA